MQKFIALLIGGLVLGFAATAQEHSHNEPSPQPPQTKSATSDSPFSIISNQKRTLKKEEFNALEKEQTRGAKTGGALVFTDRTIRLVVHTGPEDDMLSYRFQALRNPTIEVPAGAQLSILFVNTDGDMSHDMRLGANKPQVEIASDASRTVGTSKLAPEEAEGGDSGALSAEEIIVRADQIGEFVYFCSVRGHAKGGMWGNLIVGKNARADLPQPVKTEHRHSDNETEHEEMGSDNNQSGMSGANQQETAEMPGMNHQQHGSMNHQSGEKMMMRSTVNLNDPMTRESSGTAWVADSSPMYAKMKMFANGDMLMLHGNAFLRYTNVGSSRDLSIGGKGDRARFDAPTMLMAMYSHPLNNRSQIGVRAMISLDPLLERGYGYPLLYQSGEAYRNQPIHDRQHPHDLFSELSASYSYKLSEKQSAFFYVGYPGEPALGPPTFMHRVAAMNNPDAPISHHWQDSTHVTFGVVTAGYSFDKFKFEASAFKGQEPNENRWNFDAPKLNSFSGRLTFNPTKNWSFQISHGYLKNPEPTEPEIRIRRRTTASAIYNKNWADKDRNWANSFVWGQNHDDDGRTNSFLYETDYQFQKNAIFGRFERVQKSVHELVVEDFFSNQRQNLLVGLLSVGYVRDLVRNKGVDMGLGAQATWYTNPKDLTPVYGGTNHGGFQIFLRLRPSKMNHN